ERLFTPAQRHALARRDHGCSYPGCTIPAQWTEAHHITHWADGGPTDLTNGALLCGRHHTLVHQRNLTATTTDTGITWHL
ncbi:HNH endonuclease signature motif containing protein, partial [Intrasporangium mesophilum]